MYEAIEKLADVLLPARIPLTDLKAHLKGYNKDKAVKQVVERARAEPLITKIRLHLIYARLEDLFNNGGL